MQRKIHCVNLPIVQAWGERDQNSHGATGYESAAHVISGNNFNVVMKPLPGKTNGIADALSRKQFDCFLLSCTTTPTPTPGSLSEL